MELDELLGQLVDRAHEVMRTQGRLRTLLAANQLIIADLALPSVLRHIAEAARELIGARYAALGVIAPDGGLAEFVHTGMPSEAVERIGHLPEGKGLLGALIEDPRPIRLRELSEDSRSSGFPAGHPPMSSFLGVPIRIREEIFGNLYLAESVVGQFSAEDEELAKALAASAAVAIENARLYEAAQRRSEWSQASALIGRELGSIDSGDVRSAWALIAGRSREIAGTDLVAVLLPEPARDEDCTRGDEHATQDAGELRVEVAVGHGGRDLEGRRLPISGTVPGQALVAEQPVRVTAGGQLEELTALVPGGREIGPVMVVPLLAPRGTRGVLLMARLAGGPAFTAEDLEMATGFANHAMVAIELAEARAEQRRAAMLDDRERIAADLHDQVIQRLFAAGLSLQSAAAAAGPGPAADRIAATIDNLDQTISQIRTTIFELQQPPGSTDASLRGRVLEVVTELAPGLGRQPAVRFAGPLEHVATPDTVEDLLAVLREALTNVARHAHARTVAVDISAQNGYLTLVVQDDGVGIPSGRRRSGLANMRRRAERRGGTLTIQPQAPGTRLVWRVPIAETAGHPQG